MEPLTAADLAELALVLAGPDCAVCHAYFVPDEAERVCSACRELCAVCQSALETNIASLSACTHRFHDDCIRGWEATCVAKKIILSCPVCRKDSIISFSAEERLVQIRDYIIGALKDETAVIETIVVASSRKRLRLDAIHTELRALQDRIAANKTQIEFYTHKIPKLQVLKAQAPLYEVSAVLSDMKTLLQRYETTRRELMVENIALAARVKALKQNYREVYGKSFAL